MNTAEQYDRAGAIVAISTYRRPALLERLLRLIDEFGPSETTRGLVGILVIDDSPERSAHDVVDRLKGEIETKLHYESTGASDIVAARNRCLDLAIPLARHVVLIDDDCLPARGWISELLRVQGEFNADIVVGHRQFVAGARAPTWLSAQPFLEENAIYEDGSVPLSGNIANVLIRTGWLDESGVRFRREFGRVGGEDMVFLTDAAEADAEVRFAAHSLVHEPCEGHRATFRYQIWRQAWLGNNEAAINSATGKSAKGRLVGRGGKRIGRHILRPWRRVLWGQAPELRWSIAQVCSGVGLLMGVAGLHFRHRG